MDLIGDMSLMAEPGMAGVPIGHVLCHKASHELHAEFMRQLAATERSVVDTEIWVTEEQILKEGGRVQSYMGLAHHACSHSFARKTAFNT